MTRARSPGPIAARASASDAAAASRPESLAQRPDSAIHRGPSLACAVWADTPRAVAERSEIIFSIVTDSKAVRAIALGKDGIVSGLRAGGIYVDMSTIEPDESRAVAAEFSRAGSLMLDGPISGSPVTVTQGNASVMIGGDEQAFERIKPVLLAIVFMAQRHGAAVHFALSIRAV